MAATLESVMLLLVVACLLKSCATMGSTVLKTLAITALDAPSLQETTGAKMIFLVPKMFVTSPCWVAPTSLMIRYVLKMVTCALLNIAPLMLVGAPLQPLFVMMIWLAPQIHATQLLANVSLSLTTISAVMVSFALWTFVIKIFTNVQIW
jgi:hypothetical protein